MKTIPVVMLVSVCSVLEAQTVTPTANPSTVPAPTPYVVASRDANSAVWRSETYEQDPNGTMHTNVNQYVELTTGLNHLVNGQYVPSDENIVISADGSSAMATNGQHQAYFPGNIYNGEIKLVTPDGIVLQSQPIALSYFDGTNSVLLAVVTNSTGAILPSGNQVIYTNAFTGLDADFLYNYTLAGFEQDVILREQPPDPSSLGLNPQSTRLQMLTEFFSPAQPSLSATTVPTAAGNLENDNLSFGIMQMAQGKAFLLGTNTPSAAVNKQWLIINGRQFLIEEVPIVSVAQDIDTLPPYLAKAATGAKPVLSKGFVLPPQRLVKVPSGHAMQVVQNATPSHGLVLDYLTINSGQTNYTFQCDTTYYISGTVNLSQTTTVEGGTVVKFTTNATTSLNINGPLNWQAGSYYPAVFTSMDDNTVGDKISGSSGSPTNYYAAIALNFNTGTNLNIAHLRVCNAQTAIALNGGTNDVIRDVQLVNCQTGIYATNESFGLYNSLFCNMQTNFSGGSSTGDVEQMTVDSANWLNTGPTLDLTNCLLIAVTNTSGYSGSMIYSNASSAGIFQTVGAGYHYLATNSPYRGVGTSNINVGLTQDLSRMTTWPPAVLTNNFTATTNLTTNALVLRDNSATPDIGYHYDPLDYCWSGLAVSNATLELTNGVVIGFYGQYGTYLKANAVIVSQGTPVNHNAFVRYASSQEQPVQWGSVGSFVESFSLVSVRSAWFRFTDMILLAGYHYSDVVPATYEDCQIRAVNIGGQDELINYTNNVLTRCSYSYLEEGGPFQNGLINNLFLNGSISINLNNAGSSWTIENNLFDNVSISFGSVDPGNGYNAYYNTTQMAGSSGHDQAISNLDFQVGPLGNYYYPTNGGNLSKLLNVGSAAASSLGLYHYTVITNANAVEGTNIVSIGYHYVATDANGNPLDSNGDGIPDYLEDANGNGIVDNGESNWALAILVQPSNLLATVGTSPTFSVTAEGIAPIYYQWYFGSGAVLNATNAALTLSNVQTSNAGNYFAIVSNNFGSITSSVATLTVATLMITNPVNNSVFGASPTNITIQATVSVTAGTVSQVQFFQGTNSLGTLTNTPYTLVWSNATTGDYALTAVAVDNGQSATSRVVNITISPLFVTNTMVLWLKGDAITGLTTNNAPISTWPDSSGWGYNATQSTLSYKPLYETNALNGLPVVQFNGANNYFALATFLNNTTGAEAFLVIKAATNLPASNQGLWNVGGSGANYWTYYPNTAGEIADCFGSAVNYNYDIGIPAQPLNQYHLYEVSAQTNSWMAWINGSLLFEATNSTYGYGPSDLGRTSGGAHYFTGDIAEILVFSRGLSSVERGIVDSYLNSKYALLTNAPPAPTDLLAAAVSTDQVSLTWSFSLGTSPTVFTIERKLGSGGQYAAVAAVQDVTSYFDTNLTANTQYYYKVMASNWAGQSGYSNETNATTLAAGADMPLQNLVLWLKADGAMGWLTNGDVWAWFDQSGNHNDVSQKTSGSQSPMGLQPVYVTNAVSGRPALQFDGTNYYFTMPNILNNTTGAEAFLVIKAATNLPASNQGLWNVGGSDANYWTYYPNTAGEIADCFGSAVNYNYDIGKPAQLLNQYHLYDVSSQNGNWSAWVNGLLQFQTNNNAYGYAPSDLGRTSGGAHYFAGDIAEILVFNRPLAGAEKVAVGTYLFSKYNLLAYATNSSPPSSPSNVFTAGLLPGQLNVQWARTSTNETAFNVERKSGVAGTYQIIGSTVTGVTNLLDTTAIPSNTNYYRIRAVNYFGDSGYSPEISPPSVSLTNWPGTILPNTTNLIGAQAADVNGTINSVGFYVGAANQEVLLGTATIAPYTANWVSGREGPWSLAAMATDSLGNSQFSSAVTVTVYLSSNTNGIPDFLLVEQGNNPLNPWIAPSGDTNTTPPTINLVVPANATLLH